MPFPLSTSTRIHQAPRTKILSDDLISFPTNNYPISYHPTKKRGIQSFLSDRQRRCCITVHEVVYACMTILFFFTIICACLSFSHLRARRCPMRFGRVLNVFGKWGGKEVGEYISGHRRLAIFKCHRVRNSRFCLPKDNCLFQDGWEQGCKLGNSQDAFPLG